MDISGDRSLAWLLARQEKVVSRRQALRLGLSERRLDYRVRRGGPWQTLLPGVYVAATGRPTADQLDMAALLYAGQGGLITGLAALRRHQVRVQQTPTVDVLVPAQVRRTDTSYVRLHRVRRLPELATADREIRFVFVPRAVTDAARWMSDLRDVRSLVSGVVQQGRCSVDLLTAELAEPRLPGSALTRRVLAEVAAGIRSPAEADLMDLVRRSGLPQPIWNPRLYLGKRLLAVPDAWWPHASVAAEVDSQAWHLSPQDWEATMARHRRMTSAGIAVLHFSPRQIRYEQATVVAEIRAALQRGRPADGITTVSAA